MANGSEVKPRPSKKERKNKADSDAQSNSSHSRKSTKRDSDAGTLRSSLDSTSSNTRRTSTTQLRSIPSVPGTGNGNSTSASVSTPAPKPKKVHPKPEAKAVKSGPLVSRNGNGNGDSALATTAPKHRTKTPRFETSTSISHPARTHQLHRQPTTTPSTNTNTTTNGQYASQGSTMNYTQIPATRKRGKGEKTALIGCIAIGGVICCPLNTITGPCTHDGNCCKGACMGACHPVEAMFEVCDS